MATHSFRVAIIINFKKMKKRHEQKLVVITIALFMLFNVPLVLIFDRNEAIFGFPVFYFSVFSIWLMAIVLSYIVLKRYYE